MAEHIRVGLVGAVALPQRRHFGDRRTPVAEAKRRILALLLFSPPHIRNTMGEEKTAEAECSSPSSCDLSLA